MEKVMYSPEYKEVWDNFCEQQPKAWFWHTSYWLEYCLESRFGVETKNLSYLVMDDKQENVLAVVPLVLEATTAGKEFSLSAGPLPEPVIREGLGKMGKKIENFIFEEYQTVAKHNQVQRIVIRQSNIYQVLQETIDPVLIRHGYIDMTNYTSVLNLRQEEEELLAGMTKGHHSAITKALRIGVEVKIYDHLTITADKWQHFMESYFHAAGKKTRPDATFARLLQMIQHGYGYLFESVQEGKTTGFVYIIVYKTYAYYAMSCRMIEDTAAVSSQIIQWEVIKLLKKKDIIYYELGEQYFTPSFFYPVDEKMIAISQHKRGFGGNIVPQIIAEQYFSQSCFDKNWDQRSKSYKRSALRSEINEHI
jgi:hypothetical protein